MHWLADISAPMANELIFFDKAQPGKPCVATDAGKAQLRRDRRNGLPQSVCADRLGISLSTLRAMMERDDTVKEAHDVGTAELEQELVGHLLEHSRAGNVTATIFALKGLCGKRDHGEAPGAKAQTTPAVTINIPAPMSADDLANLTASMKDVTPADQQADEPATTKRKRKEVIR